MSNKTLSTLLLLDKNRLQIFDLKNKIKFETELSPDYFDKQDIKDKEKFLSAFKQFIKDNSIVFGLSLIAFTDEALFRKDLVGVDEVVLEDEINKFVAKIPLENSKINHKIFDVNGNKTIYAINREVYEVLSVCIAEFGGQVQYVVPVSVFNLSTIDFQSINQIVANPLALNQLNFLPVPVTTEIIQDAPKKKFNKMFIFIPLVIVFLMVLIIVGKTFMSKDNGTESTVVPTSVPVATTTLTPTPSINRDSLKVKVLNGSGEPGAAGVIAEILKGKGYANIETGNASNYGYEGVTVSMKETVAVFFTEIKNDLGEKYTVSSASAFLSTSTTEDVQIIFGK